MDTPNSFTLAQKVDAGGGPHLYEECPEASWKHMFCDLFEHDKHRFVPALWDKAHISIFNLVFVDIYKHEIFLTS